MSAILLLAIAVILLGLALVLPAPAWFPKAAAIVATVLAGVVIVFMIFGGLHT